jgi:aspartyl-tRNA(Asn)/glutamyl-tRNA(Gln) amidotransferase subunit C
MKISREDVSRVAELAHLELSPQELEMYRGQLDEILAYVDKLKELDVTNVEPMAQVLYRPAQTETTGRMAENPHPELRDDALVPCDTAKAVLPQSTDSAAPFFRVPRVIER